jgi:long-chain acyl-CoA synthetase
VNQQLAGQPRPVQQLFRAALRIAARRSNGQPIGALDRALLALADRLIFARVRAKFGGRLKYTVSGSAALSQEVAQFVDALGVAVFEGYGLTEASPVVSSNCPQSRRFGSVGRPLPGVRVHIDTTVTGDPGQGEIVVYGPNVMRGYHDRPEENAQAFTADGGLRTGDMGSLDQDGYLFITGRIKEQYKLENGKYVVPSPLEEDLKLSPFVANAMLYGADRPYNVALVVPDREALRHAAAAGASTPEAPLETDRVRTLVRQEIARRTQSWKSFERPRDFALIEEDFTVENGLLTPSLKLKRRDVCARYRHVIDALYAPPAQS